MEKKKKKQKTKDGEVIWDLAGSVGQVLSLTQRGGQTTFGHSLFHSLSKVFVGSPVSMTLLVAWGKAVNKTWPPWWCCQWSLSRSVMSDSLQPHGLYSQWNSPDQDTGVGSLSLLQGIFPTQGSNPGLLHCRWILYQLSHKGNPRMLEWVAYPFSSRSSRPRDWTRVSCIAGGFFFYQLSYQGRLDGVAKFSLFLKARFSHTNFWNGACPVVGFKITHCKCWSM